MLGFSRTVSGQPTRKPIRLPRGESAHSRNGSVCLWGMTNAASPQHSVTRDHGPERSLRRSRNDRPRFRNHPERETSPDSHSGSPSPHDHGRHRFHRGMVLVRIAGHRPKPAHPPLTPGPAGRRTHQRRLLRVLQGRQLHNSARKLEHPGGVLLRRLRPGIPGRILYLAAVRRMAALRSGPGSGTVVRERQRPCGSGHLELTAREGTRLVRDPRGPALRPQPLRPMM